MERSHRNRKQTVLQTLTWVGVYFLAVPAALAQAEAEKKEASQEEAVLKSINWVVGPAEAEIGDQAKMKIPEGYVFADADGCKKMLELMKNPTDGSELGLLTPKDMSWFVIFDFSSIGYVKDADQEELDAEDILDSIKEGTEANNEERQRRGWPTLEIVGWKTAPFFDKAAKNLQWCIEGKSEGHAIVNYNTRLLGRSGVMSANLLVSPDRLGATVSTIKGLLKEFSFKEGNRYAEYKPGDKIAEYGLAALVVGGAVGVAAKVGLLAKFAGLLGKLWKFIIIGLLGLGAGIKSLFSRRKPEQEAPEPTDDPPPDEETP